MGNVIQLEKAIRGKMGSIKRGEKQPVETHIGMDFKRLSKLDVTLHDDLMKQYKEVLLEKNM
jgi:hypothetical protein